MSTVEADIKHLPARAARMVAVEILLTDPDALGDDVLEAACTSTGKSSGRQERRAHEQGSTGTGRRCARRSMPA